MVDIRQMHPVTEERKSLAGSRHPLSLPVKLRSEIMAATERVWKNVFTERLPNLLQRKVSFKCNFQMP